MMMKKRTYESKYRNMAKWFKARRRNYLVEQVTHTNTAICALEHRGA
jgi:hypothetical protein